MRAATQQKHGGVPQNQTLPMGFDFSQTGLELPLSYIGGNATQTLGQAQTQGQAQQGYTVSNIFDLFDIFQFYEHLNTREDSNVMIQNCMKLSHFLVLVAPPTMCLSLKNRNMLPLLSSIKKVACITVYVIEVNI